MILQTVKKVFIIILAIIIFTTAFSGCQQKADNKALTKITVVLDYLPNTNHTGLYVAKDLGYFEANGLEVTIVQPPENGAVSLVGAGRAQFGVSFQEELAMALTAEAPIPVTAVAAIIQHNTSGILSLKKNNILRPKDLMGKRYASWQTPIETPLLTSIMKTDGGDFSKIQMIPNTATNVLAALATNVDAVWVYYGWDVIAAQVKKVDFNYFAFKDINPVFDFYTPILIANNEFLTLNPEVAKKFLESTAKGYDYSISNPDLAAKILLKNAPETDAEIATKSQDYLVSQYKADAQVWGWIDKTRWTNFYDWLYANKVISKPLGSNGFTNDYLTK